VVISFFRRRTAAVLAATTFCECCGQVCTAECRSAARRDRVRTAATSPLTFVR
jgi:hypothetical protein